MLSTSTAAKRKLFSEGERRKPGNSSDSSTVNTTSAFQFARKEFHPLGEDHHPSEMSTTQYFAYDDDDEDDQGKCSIEVEEELSGEFQEDVVDRGEADDDIPVVDSVAEKRAESTTVLKKLVKLTANSKRCIALIDLDCFFVAVERMLNPALNGVPVAVGQYTKGETLIAISYEAKAAGVKRGMFGFQARKICPELKIVQVRVKNEKADLTNYRDASAKVLAIASRYCSTVERASVDEFYLDLTEEALRIQKSEGDTADLNWAPGTLFCTEFDKVRETVPEDACREHDRFIAIGTRIVADVRKAIKDELGLDCSAGIANNKFLAKSIAGIRKPATQIALTAANIPSLCATMPVHKAKSLGGKLGEFLKEKFEINFLGEINKIDEATLCELFGAREGNRLAALANGYDDTAVATRVLPKSLGCSKTFPGKQTLWTRQEVSTWLQKLGAELIERLEKDGRRPTTVTIGSHKLGSRSTSSFNSNGRLTAESLFSISETLFDRLIQPHEIEKRGGITSLALNLHGFPDDDETKSKTRQAAVMWTCPACTFQNDSKWLKCEACGTSKSGLGSSSSSAAVGKVTAASAPSNTAAPVPANGKKQPNIFAFAVSAKNSKQVKVEEEEIIEVVDSVEDLPPSVKETKPLTPVAPSAGAAAVKPSTWTCHRCTFAQNDARFLRCEMCQSFRGL